MPVVTCTPLPEELVGTLCQVQPVTLPAPGPGPEVLYDATDTAVGTSGDADVGDKGTGAPAVPLRLGTDFSGLDAPSWALRALGVLFRLGFALIAA